MPDCEECAKSFNKPSNLNRHYFTVHNVDKKCTKKLTRAKLICAQCGEVFPSNPRFIEHLINVHKVKVDTGRKVFPSENSFMDWKRSVEGEQGRFKCHSVRTADEQVTRYYVCSRLGRFSPVTESLRNRSLKTKRSRKVVFHCCARIAATFKRDGSVEVDYCNTHFGHGKELAHFPLRSADKRKIASQMAAKVLPRAVLDDTRSRTMNGAEMKRIHLGEESGNDTYLALISLYEGRPELWQPYHKHYFNKTKKNDAWEAIATQLHTTSEAVKTKMNSLLASYRREKNKEESSRRTGNGTDEIYTSKWYAYEALGFLRDKNKCKKTINSCTSQNSSQENDSKQIQPARASTSDGELIEENKHVFPSKKPTQATSLQHSTKPIVTKRNKKSARPLSQVGQVVDVLQHSLRRDGCDVYGEHVAMKLKTYSSRTQAIVQHYVNNILFEADMGRYDVPDNNNSHKNQTISPTHSAPPSPAISPYPPHQDTFSTTNSAPPHSPTTSHSDASVDATSFVVVVASNPEVALPSETGTFSSSFQT